MKLTGFAKFFITIIVLGVVGFLGCKFYLVPRQQAEANADGGAGGKTSVRPTTDDFASLHNTPDPDRKSPVAVNSQANVGSGKLGRKLVVGINTWAGHSPGIVANLGMDGGNA